MTGLNLFLFFQLRKTSLVTQMPQWILGLIGAEIFTGILMYYFDFPFATQPLHLLLATLLFGVQLYWILRINLHRYDLSL
mgnify:CR=1 FL=1